MALGSSTAARAVEFLRERRQMRNQKYCLVTHIDVAWTSDIHQALPFNVIRYTNDTDIFEAGSGQISKA